MGFNSIGKEIIIEKNEKSVILEINLTPSCAYFDGHFPDFPIFPAVAQIELVARFASKYLGTSIALTEIKRVKFSSLIRPSASLLLKLEKKEKVISFNLSSKKDNTVYSAGTVAQGDM
jgi:3-hydroxymyristoyl/3-hydroxydecanoyl-(acyl carrier protein) dehydratase